MMVFCIPAVSYRENLHLFLPMFHQLENRLDCFFFPHIIKHNLEDTFPTNIVCILQAVSDSHVYA